MAYLDEKGLAHYHENLKPSLVKGVTQAEWNALPEAVRKSGMYVITDAEGSGGAGAAGEVYSTEETRIGTWIDGKPLYRKVCATSVGLPASAVGENYRIVLIENEWIALKKAEGNIDLNGKTYCVPFSEKSGGSGCVLQSKTGAIFFDLVPTSAGSVTVYAILEYTKTTDTPEVTA